MEPGAAQAVSARAVRVSRTDTLTGIGDDEWDDLIAAPSGFYTSRRWLCSVQAEPGTRCWYLLARIGHRLVGALPVYDTVTGPAAEPHYRITDRWPTRDGRRYLLVGSASGYHTSLVLAPDLPEDTAAAVLSALLAEARRDAAADKDVAGIAMLFTEAGSARRVGQLLGDGARPSLSLGADAAVSTGAATTADLRSGLPKKARERWRYDFDSLPADFVLSEREGAAESDPEEVGHFVHLLEAKYNGDKPAAHWVAVFARQLRYLGDSLTTFRMTHLGQTCGLTVAYRWRRTLFVRMGGFESVFQADLHCGYLNLAYYLPVDYAVRERLHSARFGLGSERDKIRRGAHLEPLVDFAWSVSGDPLPPRGTHGVDHWRARREELGGGFDRADWQQWLDAS